MTKIIALAVAGLSTAAFAQTNVTIYGVGDLSVQGTNVSQSLARTSKPAGGVMTVKNNSSLIGFKGTEALGNGLTALFQYEMNIDPTGHGSSAGVKAVGNGGGGDAGWTLRDTYLGMSSKYGTGMAGYLSSPFRTALTSFDVMPGATGDGRIESLLGKVGYATSATYTNSSTSITANASATASSSVRTTAIAYAMPTLYGFNGAIAYTGSNNNANSNQTNADASTSISGTTVTSKVTPNIQSALAMNLGWSGYGVDIKGAFSQAKLNVTVPQSTVVASDGTVYGVPAIATNLQGLTSYLVGAAYTGLPGLKASVVYNRNTLGTNATSTAGAEKGSNNSVYVGASYRFGNNEPRLSWQHMSATSGLAGVSQNGATQWTANWGYYLSKRTQVYGLVSGLNNSANANNNLASGGTSIAPVAGNSLITYGAGLRTNF